LNILGNQTIL